MSQCGRRLKLTCPVCNKAFTRSRCGRPSRGCRACVKSARARKVALPPKLFDSEADERELGPDRPLQGWTEAEYEAWRRARVVSLYLSEPELPVSAIAERLGMAENSVSRILRAAGARELEGGHDERASLPMGLPPG